MRKRIFSTVVIVLSVASIAVATLVAQRAAQRAKTSTPPAAGGQAATKGKKPAANRNASTAQAPLRQPDPNRAPQAAVDEALYTNEEFFGTQASVARPYGVALERVSTLLGQYPK